MLFKDTMVDVLLSTMTARLGTARTAWMNEEGARNKGVVSRDNWKLRRPRRTQRRGRDSNATPDVSAGWHVHGSHRYCTPDLRGLHGSRIQTYESLIPPFYFIRTRLVSPFPRFNLTRFIPNFYSPTIRRNFSHKVALSKN